MRKETSIINHTVLRPNSNSKSRTIPDDSPVWEELYSYLSTLYFNHPILNIDSKIDPFFGYFGFRYHPIKQEKNYFHTGIDIVDEFNIPVFPILDGLLQYSGYHSINGNYVMLSHPQIELPQNLTLYSLYLHLNSYSKRFTFLNKVIRELGFKKMTNIKISQNEAVGTLGDSGISKDIFTHLHLQIELRSVKNKQIIILDPLKCFGFETKINLSTQVNDLSSLRKLISGSELKTNYRI